VSAVVQTDRPDAFVLGMTPSWSSRSRAILQAPRARLWTVFELNSVSASRPNTRSFPVRPVRSRCLMSSVSSISMMSCLDTIENDEACFVGGPPSEGGEPGIVTGLSAHELALSILCQAPSGQECITGATEYKAWAARYGAKVTLSDFTPPTLGTPSGALWEPGTADGFHKGTENLNISAEDVGGGVQSIVLSADGQPLQTYHASCNFTFAQPCPLSIGPQTFTLPTTSLTDGTLTLTAIDAAGNQSTVASQQITIDNDPPPPPTELSATPTQTDSTTFIATWKDPSDQVASITSATYQVCPAIGTQACGTPVTAPAEGPVSVSVPGPGTWTLMVWLTNAAGNSNPTNTANMTLTVPALDGSGPGGSANNGSNGASPGPNGSGDGSPGAGQPTNLTPKPTIHMTETLRGRELAVHISGPATGRVRVSYIARWHNKTIASKAKAVILKNGRLTATFRLSARAAARAVIRVSAQLNHQPVVDNTLRRRATPPYS
jgi:hypothetical protein